MVEDAGDCDVPVVGSASEVRVGRICEVLGGVVSGAEVPVVASGADLVRAAAAQAVAVLLTVSRWVTNPADSAEPLRVRISATAAVPESVPESRSEPETVVLTS